MDANRRTTLPIKSIPQIVEWLLKNCNKSELEFMASIASSRTNLKLLTSIFTRLTDYNVQEVFYERISDPNELLMFRASKRGEVAGLKAFSMACQAALVELTSRRKEK
jgi:hypothetical protein